MSRNGYQGPRLPKFLLDQVQTSDVKRRHESSRKDRRRAERQQKKAAKSQPKSTKRRPKHDLDFDDGGDAARESYSPAEKASSAARTIKAAKPPLKSILKPTTKPAAPTTTYQDAMPDPTVVRRNKQRLQEDDAEISALEKKLGIRGKKSKPLEEDGLDWIAEGEDSDEDGGRGIKRKRPEDTKWLKDKRLKASVVEDVESDDASDTSDEDEIENPFSDDEVDADDFDGFESEDDVRDEIEHHLPPKKRKENPYVPPVADNAAPPAKYIPPSLRAPASEDEETLKQVRRQVQGLLNRLSESNMFSIVQSLEEMYSKNARQHITSTLVDLLSTLVADPAVLNDSFLVLHAGFAAAIYKTAGTDFAAHLLERVVEKLDQSYDSEDGKQALNLLAFLCNLYLFQVVGGAIIFDYIRMLLDNLSENNTELLLRMIRLCGQSLRQNDPSALKDVVLLLQRSVSKIGEANVSVRTKFMIETINDLKNNRMKAANSSVLAAEQTARMKKTLGSVGKTKSFKSTEPLSITLADIRDSDKKGKWWLVGASYHDPSKLANNISVNTKKPDMDDEDAGYASESELNLNKLAREQGMNTEVRRAIFVTILSSVDYHHAHMQLIKLHLKNKQQLEIPRVLVHCVKAEDAYNPFYALVAMKFTGEHQKRKAFEFALWDFFRQMNSDDQDGEEITVRKIVNMAKFYATLVAEGGLRMTVLKKLDFTPLDRNSAMFVEVFLTHVFTQASKPVGKKRFTDAAFEDAVKKIFTQVAGAGMEVIQGLRHVTETSVAKADLALGKKETKAVETGCQVAAETLQTVAIAAPIDEDESDSA